MTRETLAVAIDRSVATVENILAGRGCPLDTLGPLGEALHVEPADLLRNPRKLSVSKVTEAAA